MSENQRTIHASPDAVWRVVRDGRLYPLWGVGATPLREADVLIELEPTGDGSGPGTSGETVVRIHEDAASGPGRLVPGVVRSPLMKWRNSESLRRLAFLAEGRAEGRTPTDAH